MIVLGLTGSIAMGKSTAAAMFRRLRVPVYDADRAVHRLLDRGGAAIPAIDRLFPGVVVAGRVDRPALGARVFKDRDALHRLEAVLHPLVREAREQFLALERRRGTGLVVLDIPLLYETGYERSCDAVAVVSAPTFVQMQRLRQRPHLDAQRIDAILARQIPDGEKRRRAHFVIPSGLGRALTWRTITRIVSTLRDRGLRSRDRNGKPSTNRPRRDKRYA